MAIGFNQNTGPSARVERGRFLMAINPFVPFAFDQWIDDRGFEQTGRRTQSISEILPHSWQGSQQRRAHISPRIINKIFRRQHQTITPALTASVTASITKSI